MHLVLWFPIFMILTSCDPCTSTIINQNKNCSCKQNTLELHGNYYSFVCRRCKVSSFKLTSSSTNRRTCGPTWFTRGKNVVYFCRWYRTNVSNYIYTYMHIRIYYLGMAIHVFTFLEFSIILMYGSSKPLRVSKGKGLFGM